MRTEAASDATTACSPQTGPMTFARINARGGYRACRCGLWHWEAMAMKRAQTESANAPHEGALREVD